MLPRPLCAVVLGLMLAGTAPALAQPAAPPFNGPRADPYGDATVTRDQARASAEERFAALDANHDGSLSADERAAARPEGGGEQGHRGGWGGRGMGGMADDGDPVAKAAFVDSQLRRFDLADADHDGNLTKAERDAARAAMRARMEERMRDMPMPPEEGPGGGDQN